MSCCPIVTVAHNVRMPEKPRTLRRIVKAKDGRQVFRIATVKRDPFKQEYIDLCSSSFDEVLCSPGQQSESSSSFDQVSARGRHALERSEIIKAQSLTLGKMVSGALRAQVSAPKADGSESEEEAAGIRVAKDEPAASALDQDEVLRRYKLVLAGNPEPLPLESIFGDGAFASFATPYTDAHDDDTSGDSSQDSPVDVGEIGRAHV